MSDIVIAGMARTPIGSFQGSLSSLPAPRLGAVAIQAAMERAGVEPSDVSEVIMGNVLSAGEGQAPARQASIYAGIPDSVPTMTINKVCGSGMMAIILGMRSIRLGESDVVVAGGMESMSQAPYLLPGARDGFRLGHGKAMDSMILDGLWDPFGDQHAGSCADLCAKEKNISREDQDAFATESYRRAQEAQKDCKFSSEIAPVSVKKRREEVEIDQDEEPSQVKFDRIPTLKPVFDKEGTVTAANASTINDGAAAVVLMSEETADKLGCKPLARIVSHGIHAQEPVWFTTAPIGAVPKALEGAGWKTEDVDLFEINEAFAVVALAAQRELGIDHDKLNVWGGAVALGHPIGATGARITVTLLSALADRGKSKGLASLCIGGGEATALCLERL